jgi:drug/metabolite transporter (DMT)-like permease
LAGNRITQAIVKVYKRFMMAVETPKKTVSVAAFGTGLILLSAASFSLNTPLAPLIYADGGNPATVIFMRVAVAAMVLIAITLYQRCWPPLAKTDLFWLAVAAVTFTAQGLCYLGAVARIPVGLAALIFFFWPMAVAALAPLIGERRPATANLMFFLLAFIGLALALTPDLSRLDPWGMILAFSGGLLIAVYMLSVRQLSVKFAGIGLTAAIAVPSALVALAVLPWMGGMALPQSEAGIFALIALCLFFGIGMLALVFGMASVAASRTAFLYNLEPILSIGAAAVLLGEVLTANQYAGGAMVVSALLLSSWRAASKAASSSDC